MIRAGETYSDDLAHRYRCWRRWDDNILPVLFMVMRPSHLPIAEDMDLHETSARQLGYGGFEICSFYAAETGGGDAIGPDNMAEVFAAIHVCSTVVFDIAPWEPEAGYEMAMMMGMRQAAHDNTDFRIATEHLSGRIVKTAPFNDWPLDREDAPELPESTPE